MHLVNLITTLAIVATSASANLSDYLSEAVFHRFFPHANPVFTYANLVNYATEFDQLANSGDAETDKRELAAFLAHVTRETGWLRYPEELAKNTKYAPFIGRGALQLTWDYNYKAFGDAIGQTFDRNTCTRVATQSDLIWRSAFWFWYHNGMHMFAGEANGGFAKTTRKINGGECGRAAEKDRIQHFESYCRSFGVSPGTNLSCKPAI
ncbi:Aste57867_13225 [Aphanomyces stellatus]|uniref:Aste57867_13225 protein n=1 Tax=Aphanomyces stellatus TaxID=120398 RepID=A0A485KZM9_9STRA|nr:hypothetical protein As57867_013176 [Aphanomyces stellatus]VFT90065.1 Aste57867_13225 [Aphanomyces stellatus]